MSKKDQKLYEEEVRRRYHAPGCQAFQLRSKNAIFLNSNNSIKHEMAKSLGAYMLHKWGDVFFDAHTIKILDELDKYIQLMSKDWPANPVNFITEGVPKEEPKRRVDLVGLKDDTRFEFECDHSISKEHAITIKI